MGREISFGTGAIRICTPFREDPAAIYGALIEMHEKTHKPLFVSETGVATERPEQLKRYMERALYAIDQAVQEGAGALTQV